MNDQIDSSIPVLTEVIAPMVTTPAASESKPPEPRLSPAHASAAPVRPAPPEIKAAPTGNVLPKPAPIQSTTSATAVTGLAATTAPTTPTTNAGSDKKVGQQASLPILDKPDMSDEAFQLMEQTVRENVLRQVLSRVDFVLEHRVRDSLAEVLQNAVDQLADDIRAGLRQSLEEVVTRAVTQELTKLKSHKS